MFSLRPAYGRFVYFKSEIIQLETNMKQADRCRDTAVLAKHIFNVH